MKVHLVFSLNKTGSFENGIIYVVSTARYRFYIWLIIKLRKSLRLLDTLSQKNYLLQTIIKCNNMFHTNNLLYFPEGTKPSWKFTQIPGAGGLLQAPPTVHKLWKFQGVWG